MTGRLPPEYDVSRETHRRLETYVDLLARWQARMNLVSRLSLENVWQRHILDSAQLINHMPAGTRRWVDLGTGGGAPGLIIALLSTPSKSIHVDLVESNTKKCGFLREVVRVTGAPADVHNCRIEDFDSEPRQGAYDVVSARALAPLARLLDYAHGFIQAGARGLFLKGQHVDMELTDATKYWKIDHEIRPSQSDSRGSVLIIERAERVTQ